MPLFTFLLEYEGGTYVSQVSAASPNLAPKAWAEGLDWAGVWKSEPLSKDELVDAMQSSVPTPINGVKHTWCCAALLNGHTALIHFIQTAE